MMIRLLFSISILLFTGVNSFAQKALYKHPADHWAPIPSGTCKLGNGDTVGVKAFWMSKTEISNFEYREFVAWVAKSGDTAKLRHILPDTLVWRAKLSYNEPYVEYYFRHPAYADYPVVGVSHEAAKLYCVWLTEIFNARLQELFPKLKARAVEVRLPTETEWVWAARGGHKEMPYPWGGPYLRNAQGDFMCNISRLGDESISFDPKGEPFVIRRSSIDQMTGKSYPDVTAPVKSYWPNDYGLYNMSGNVAEMLAQAGVAKGGSWFTGGYDAQIDAPDPHLGNTAPTSYIGFRPMFVVLP